MADPMDDHALMARLQKWVRWEQARRRISQNKMAELLGLQSGTMTRYMAEHGQIPGVGFVRRVYELVRDAEISARQLLLEDPPETAGQASPPEQPEPALRRPIANPPRSASPRPPATRRKKGHGGGSPT